MKKEYPDILKLEGEKWQNPDPATGKLGTRVPAEWLQTTEDSLKSLTLEMLEVLKAAGINPNELNNTQVRDAIQKMILARVINYNDIVGRPIVKDSLGDDRNNPASQRVVNDVNRDVVTAQKTANTANDKANSAQNRADSAYSLANSKRDLADRKFDGALLVSGGGTNGDAIIIDDSKAVIGYSTGRGGLWFFSDGKIANFPKKSGVIGIENTHSAPAGWWKCGDTGMIIQRGEFSAGGTTNFPISFSNASVSITTSIRGSHSRADNIFITNITATGFSSAGKTPEGNSLSPRVLYIAIGY